MKNQTLSKDASLHLSYMRPEFRGNLFLGLLLGVNLLIALPNTAACASEEQPKSPETTTIQTQNRC